MHSVIVVCNGLFVVWAPFPLTVAEAWQIVRYSDQREYFEDVRVFPCNSESQAAELQSILA